MAAGWAVVAGKQVERAFPLRRVASGKLCRRGRQSRSRKTEREDEHITQKKVGKRSFKGREAKGPNGK